MTEGSDKYPVKIARKGIVIWGGLILFAMGWMFVVGILVGRGLAPVPDPDHQVALQEELETLKEEKLAEEQAKIEAQAKLDKEKGRHLPFYDELKKPPAKTAYKVLPPTAVKRPAEPAPPKAVPPPVATPAEKPAEKRAVALPAAVETRATPVPAAKPAATPKPTPAPAAEPVRSKDHFTVQVGAFKDLESAERMVKNLRDKGYPAYHLRVAVPGKGEWFRVRVGAFDNRPAAETMLKKMDRQGYQGMVVNS